MFSCYGNVVLRNIHFSSLPRDIQIYPSETLETSVHHMVDQKMRHSKSLHRGPKENISASMLQNIFTAGIWT
jgi:hypothetical protein